MSIAVHNEYIVIQCIHNIYVHNQITGRKQTLKHTEFVWDISITDQYIILGLQDHTVRVLNMNKDLIWELNGHTEAVYCVCITLDNKYIISGSLDTTVRIWDIESGHCKRILQGHTRSVSVVCVSACNRFIISGSEDGTIKIWDMNGGNNTALRTIAVYDFHYNVKALCVSGNYIFSKSHDSSISIWDMNDGECIDILDGHTATVATLCVSGDFLISGSKDGDFRVWSIESGGNGVARGGGMNPRGGECLHILNCYGGYKSNYPWCVRTTLDGQFIISQTNEFKLYIWHILTGARWNVNDNGNAISLPDSRVLLYSLLIG